MKMYILTACFIALDVVTGLIKGSYQGKIDSAVLRKGLYNKIAEILAVAVVTLIQYALQYINIGVEIPLVEMTVVYIVIMEAVSIIENICMVNPALFKFFSPYLAKLRGELDDQNTKRD